MILMYHFYISKKEQYHPKGHCTEGIFGVLQRLQTSLPTILLKRPGFCFLGLVLILVPLSSLACFSSVRTVLRLRSWRTACQRVSGKSAVARYKHDLCDHSTLITSKG